MAYQLNNSAPLDDWFEREPDPDLREHVLSWIANALVADPSAVESFPLPTSPVVVAALVPGTDVFLTYVVVEQYRAIRLMSVGRLQDLLSP